MTPLQAVITVVVALIAALGGTFGFLQFMINRKDEKEEKFNHEAIQKQIDESLAKAEVRWIAACGEIGDKQIADAVDKARTEFQEGLEMRRNESTERYLKHSGDIEVNTAMIKEVLEIQKQTNEKFDQLAESMIALNEATTTTSQLTKACAEGVRSTNYDKMLVVAKKALKRGAITISEKTNLKQLYSSYKELQGNDSKITTYYEDCLELPSIPDEDE